MATPKILISASYAIPRLGLPSKPAWSETLIAAGTTANGAPTWLEPAQVFDNIHGEPLLTFTAVTGDWFVSLGDPPPDPARPTSPRFLVREGESLTVAVTPHHRARVAPAP